MIEKDSNCTVYRNVVKADNRKEIFQTRMENVLKVRSYHMLPVEKGRLYDYPVVYYKETCEETLQTLIDRGVELLATELKNITWQIAKLMLSCEEFKVNHLRLHPKSIGLQRKYDPERPLFLQVKDFSMGKEFSQVSEGKHLEYFEYQHPDLSISNQMIDFDVYQPRYDIWSLGIILYHLIYRQSPFCKPGNNIFSKTILNKYCAYDYQIPYPNPKYNSINIFISECLALKQLKFTQWLDIRKWIVDKEEIYNELDFIDASFQEMAEIHIRLMSMFSGIYCMIIDQCCNSPHAFWRKPVSKELRVPFQIKIGEFTLRIMKTMEERFHRVYNGHLFLLKQKPFAELLALISKKLEIELAHVGNDWLERKFKDSPLNLQVIRVIQQVCATLKLELSEVNMQLSSSRKINDSNTRNSFIERKMWKSMETLYDYCNETIFIFNQCKNRMKYIFQQFYISTVFEAIAIKDFGYHSTLKISIAEITKRNLGLPSQ